MVEHKFGSLAVSDLFSDTPIDLQEVQERIYTLLTIIEEQMLPLMSDYKRYQRVDGAHGQKGRQEAAEKMSLLLKNMGVTTSGESDITVGQPCMLIWSAMGSSRGNIDPILIELARVTSKDTHSNLGLDVMPLLEIPFGTTQIQRVTRFSSEVHHRTLWDGQEVLLPLTGGGVDFRGTVLLSSGE